VETHRRIGIEDLNAGGMVWNRHLARSGFFDFRRQRGYKARFYGAVAVMADRLASDLFLR
jgi:putative transposase